MRRAASSIFTLIHAFGRDQRGATAAIVALLSVAMVGLSGLVIDFGHVYAVQRSLQASADAAALAGGYDIPTGTAIATANSYSAQAGDKNAASDVAVAMVSGYPKLNCYSTTGITCVKTAETSSSGANGIQVKEQAVVPTYFTRIAGISSVTVTAIATAGAKGGNGQALNVMIVLDTTASMSSNKDPNCGLGSNATRESCALAGVRALLSGLNPSLDYAGLMVFPGLASASDASYDYTCGKTLPTSDIAAYSNSPVYSVVGLNGSNDFKTSNSSNTLNSSSNIVLAANGGGCSSGVTAPGGVGTYYAGALIQAQAALNSFAAPHTQNVIVFLSDGDAGSNKVQTDFTGYISGTTMTVSSITAAEGSLSVGQSITGSGVTAGTVIAALGTGNGGNGIYTVNHSQTVGSKTKASALTAANVLTLNGKSFVQNTNQCAQAVAAAQAAAAAGTWVYSVAYGGSTAATPSTCVTDSPAISSCTTMQNIASDASKFYSDGNNGVDCPGGNTIENLVSLFGALSQDLTLPRLLPDNTT
jgi:Flp pilus assembly protein TadG